MAAVPFCLSGTWTPRLWGCCGSVLVIQVLDADSASVVGLRWVLVFVEFGLRV